MILNDTLSVINQRRSVREYKTEQIIEEQLQAILEAGQSAPYAWPQGRHFSVIQNRELLDRLNDAAKEVARGMNVPHFQELGNDKEFYCLYGAPTLIIVSGSEEVPIPLEADCAAAMQNMLIAAESLGLGSCWIYFVLLALQSGEGGELRKELKIPEGYKPFYSAVFGYKADGESNPSDRVRCPVTYVR